MLLTLLLLLAGLVQPGTDSATPARTQLAADTVPLPDGMYASRQIMTASTRPGPRLGRIRVRTVALAIHRVRREADTVRVSTKFCDVRQDRIGPAGTVLDSAFIASLPEWESAVTIEGEGPWSVRTGDYVAVVGAELEDPAADPLPTDPDDSRVTDPDGDGQPGVTVRIEGVVSGGVYVVQRIERALEGTLTSDGRMTGTVIGSNQQAKLGASNFILRAFTPTFIADTEPEHNPFSWAPVSPDADCARVVEAEAALFGVLE
jgi:hypothetical protein